MTKVTSYCFLILVLTVVSCVNKSENENAVARVYNSYLHQDDLSAVLPQSYLEKDSLLITKNYINNWAKEQLLLKKAEINLSEDVNQINELVAQYRQDLLVNKYKEAVVEQYLDTLATSKDVAAFYNENKEIFKLNEELVKLKYIYFGNEILNPKDFEELFRSSKKEDLDSLKSKELQLKSYNLNDSIWIRLDDVLREIPSFNNNDKERILNKSNFFEKKDSLGVYLVAVKEVLKRGEIAPMSYVIPTVKQMILHRRKLELFKKIEETLIEDAINNKEFEIYERE